jgi:hypothetical protein
VVAAVGFLAFPLQGFTEAQPIVDLRRFRRRGLAAPGALAAAVVTIGFSLDGAVSTPRLHHRDSIGKVS